MNEAQNVETKEKKRMLCGKLDDNRARPFVRSEMSYQRILRRHFYGIR